MSLIGYGPRFHSLGLFDPLPSERQLSPDLRQVKIPREALPPTTRRTAARSLNAVALRAGTRQRTSASYAPSSTGLIVWRSLGSRWCVRQRLTDRQIYGGHVGTRIRAPIRSSAYESFRPDWRQFAAIKREPFRTAAIARRILVLCSQRLHPSGETRYHHS